MVSDDGNSRGRTVVKSPTHSRSSSTSSVKSTHSCTFPNCEKTYSKPSLLTQHLRSHTNERPFKCQTCDSSFLRKDHLERHVTTHFDDKPFKCSHCGKGVATAQHLKRHEITHTKSFKCEFENCSESFYKHQSLKAHVSRVHCQSNLICVKCQKSFARPYRLAHHMEKHHGDSPAYQCTFTNCVRCFKTWSALQLHMKSDHPKVSCPICFKKCVGGDGLRMHMSVHESKTIQIWNCSFCCDSFPLKSELVSHCNKLHNQNAEYAPEELPHAPSPLPETPLTPPMSVEDDEVLETCKWHSARRSSTQSLPDALDSASAISLISTNVDEKRLSCSYRSCDRMFKRDYDLQRHLSWHEHMKVKLQRRCDELAQENLR